MNIATIPPMRIFIDIPLVILAILSSPLWLINMMRRGKLKTDWGGRLGKVPEYTFAAGKKRLLIHAVSVGEVNATRELVGELKGSYGEALEVIIATTTDTGFARATSLYGGEHLVVRYPFDFNFATSRFLRALKPDLVVLMELEVWPNFVAQCEKRKIPVAVVNGRLSERSYKRYLKIRFAIWKSFARLKFVAAQDADYAERFIGMGASAERVSVCGTMKWDTAVISDTVEGAEAFGELFGIDRGRALIVCGSTGPGEEQLMLDALGDLRTERGRVQLLFAPRKPERFDEAAVTLGGPVRFTEVMAGGVGKAGADVFLLDTIGDLRKAYALADLVVVGRSFSPQYGSDMIEPVALGRAVVIGPNVSDFQQSMDALLAGGGICQVKDAVELRGAVERLLESEAGRELAERGRAVIRGQQGATQRHVGLIVSSLGIGDG